MPNKYVFQGVHMIFRGGFTSKLWKAGETRECRFVFIGRNLKNTNSLKDAKKEMNFLEEGVRRCRVDDANGDLVDGLRFKVGALVEAKTGVVTRDGGGAAGSWRRGRIIATWEDGNPYRIQLEDDGTQVWGPIDSEQYVRAVERKDNVDVKLKDTAETLAHAALGA